MADFEPSYEATILAEGGYQLTDTAGDNGGQTYAGISRKKNPNWEGWRWIDANQTPPTHMVRSYYKKEYWDAIKGDAIISQEIAENIYDFGVNAGQGVARKLAQIVVGTTPDGVFGEKTLMALNSIDADRFKPIYALAKIARYRDIVKRDRTQIKWLMGWINRTLEQAA